MSDPSALYRFYDASGTLLYVGITRKLLSRLRQHASGKPWWLAVATISIERFDTYEEARARELQLIRTLRPRYNGDRLKGPEPQPYRAFVPDKNGGGKTHCLRGHQFDSENTIVSNKGNRQCRACRKAMLARQRNS